MNWLLATELTIANIVHALTLAKDGPKNLNSHKNKGHTPFFLPPIMRLSVGQCRNIRFRQLYASHVIITSVLDIELIE